MSSGELREGCLKNGKLCREFIDVRFLKQLTMRSVLL